MPDYAFSNDWFARSIPVWGTPLPSYNPTKILEIRSFESQSIGHLLETLGNSHPLDIYCMDMREEEDEHGGIYLPSVETLLDQNMTPPRPHAKHPVNFRPR